MGTTICASPDSSPSPASERVSLLSFGDGIWGTGAPVPALAIKCTSSDQVVDEDPTQPVLFAGNGSPLIVSVFPHMESCPRFLLVGVPCSQK